jgi:hypothetical protein
VSSADLIVYVIDATAPLTPDTATTEAALRVRVLNKADHGVPPGAEYDVATIATSGQGIDKLRRVIRQRLRCGDLDPTRPRVWTERQRDALARGQLESVLD